MARRRARRAGDLVPPGTLGAAVQYLVDVTAFTFMALFIARLGAVNSAAHQIAGNVAAVMYMLPLALGNGVGVLVAQAVGARKLDVARSTGITGIGLAAGLGALAASMLVAGAAAVTAPYTEDGAVRALTATLPVLVALYHVFDAVQVVAVSALRGYKRAVVPMVISAVSLWGVGLAGGYAIGLSDALDLSRSGCARRSARRDYGRQPAGDLPSQASLPAATTSR